MNLIESLRTAFTALGANKTRSFLTMLGIIIGVAAVIVLLSIGQGVQATVTDTIQGLGSNLIGISADPSDDHPDAAITDEDARALADPLFAPALAAVAPVLNGSLHVSAGGNSASLPVVATTPEYAGIRSLELAMGSFFTDADLDDSARVVVLGWSAYTELFGEGTYPIDQTVRIGETRFRVIGVLVAKGGVGPLANQDETLYVPLSTGQARLFSARTLTGATPLSSISATVADESQMDAAERQIEDILRERHRLAVDDENDFGITSQQDILETSQQITGLLTAFLGVIAGISLLVGGIGIMNIMLVTVTERTREIGIRKAIGAASRDILMQFLIEALVLSLGGGILGIALGIGGAELIGRLAPDITPDISLGIVALASGVASAVGLGFGIYPAMRAARLRPIQALRYE